MMWSEAPDILEVENALKALASIRGRILRQKRTIQKAEDVLKKEYPRQPDARRAAMEKELDALVALEIDEIEALMVVDFNKMRIDMFKTYNYKKQ